MVRGLAVLLLIMLAETVHGTLRGLFLVPAVGTGVAALIGWPVAVIIVMAIAILCAPWVAAGFRRPISPDSRPDS